MWQRIQIFAFTFCGLVTAALSFGEPPFLITAMSTGTTPVTVSQGGSNLPNLLDNLIEDKSQFSTLSNQAATATVRYGSENNAILVNKNAAGTSATVSIPSIGFTKTFTGATPNDLKNAIINYAKKNGADIYGQFIRSINERTTLGVTDGNPLAATAIFADRTYFDFGLQPDPVPGAGTPNPLDRVATPNIRLDFDGGYARTDGGDGYYAGGAFSFGFKFGDRVGLVFTTPFEYRFINGAATYTIAEEFSLPIVILPPSGQSGLSWMVTPSGVVGGAGSEDLASGGVFAGGGITSSLSGQFAGFVVTLADQFDYYHGFPITVGDYRFETNLDQEILKNGIQVMRYLGNNLYIDGGITYSNFLQHAAVREYWTPTAGIGLRFSQRSGVRLGFVGDYGSRFNDYGGTVQVYFNF